MSTKRLFLSITSNPSSGSILMSAKTSLIGMSGVDTGVDNINSTIHIDVFNVSPNTRSRLQSIFGIYLCPE